LNLYVVGLSNEQIEILGSKSMNKNSLNLKKTQAMKKYTVFFIQCLNIKYQYVGNPRHLYYNGSMCRYKNSFRHTLHKKRLECRKSFWWYRTSSLASFAEQKNWKCIKVKV
jgi:hypothetical protein